MEGLVRERETKLNQTTDERVRLISDRLDGFCSKNDEPNQLDSNMVLESIDARLAILEKAIEQMVAIGHRDCVLQESTSQSLDGRSSSATPSDTTAFMTSTLEDRTCISSSNYTDESSSSSDNSSDTETVCHGSDKIIPVSSENQNIPIVDAVNSQPTFRKQSDTRRPAKRKFSRLEIHSTVGVDRLDLPIATSSFNQNSKVVIVGQLSAGILKT